MTTLVAFDIASNIPFYRQIYDGYRSAILAGRLRPGERLPSTRALAAERLRAAFTDVAVAAEDRDLACDHDVERAVEPVD